MNADALDKVLARMDLRYRAENIRERIIIAIAWALPHELVKWAYLRVMAHATTGKWGMEHPASVTFDKALTRWEQPNPPRKYKRTYFPTASDESYGERGAADVQGVLVIAAGVLLFGLIGAGFFKVWNERQMTKAYDRQAAALERIATWADVTNGPRAEIALPKIKASSNTSGCWTNQWGTCP